MLLADLVLTMLMIQVLACWRQPDRNAAPAHYCV